MQEALREAAASIEEGGGPFGAVVIRDGNIVGRGRNRVVRSTDPTAHAEVVAIRAACEALGTHVLTGCVLYSSCEPCPMCLGAILWARLDQVRFGATREEASGAGFDDAHFYDEVARGPAERELACIHEPSAEARAVFESWKAKEDRVGY